MNHHLEALLETIVIAISLGIFAQVFAHRYKLPAILPLLLFGMAAGPFGLGVFDQAAPPEVSAARSSLSKARPGTPTLSAT